MSDTRSTGLRQLDVEAALADVTRRLTGRFSPPLPQSVVAATISGFAAQWQEARVTEFVPLLVERRSTAQLRKLLADQIAPRDRAATPNAEGLGQVA
jgi:hypothetical protein